jgi:molecular chaperone GrpE (heat shock protein)
MGLMTKEYEAEKDKIIKATDKTIEELKTTNAELNIKIGDKSDKMHQMGKEIESLTKRANELSMQKINYCFQIFFSLLITRILIS